MKFNLHPEKHDLSESEQKTLIKFYRAIDDACDRGDCENCLLHDVCEDLDTAPSMLYNLFEALGIF